MAEKIVVPGLGEITERELLARVKPKRRGYGLKQWIENFFLNLSLPEPHSLRQVFYVNVPVIARTFREYVRKYPDNWADRIYSMMSSILSNLVLDHRCSYRKLKIMDDSGASNYVYQNFVEVSVPPPEKCFVEYPIEVWVENNATYNCLKPLFVWNREKEGAIYQLNLISGKGFAKTNRIEQAWLDRRDDLKFVLYFGDFDPSGVEMPHDIQRRFKRIGLDAQVVPIGVFPQQIPEERKITTLARYKRTDTRAKKFMAKYGVNAPAYETQALTPSEMRNLVSRAIELTINKFGLKRLVD